MYISECCLNKKYKNSTLFFTLATSQILNTELQTENILLKKFTVRKKKGL